MYLASSLRVLKGLPRLSGRSGQYGIKVSFGGSGTLKIVVIYVKKITLSHAYFRPLERIDQDVNTRCARVPYRVKV